MPEQQYRTGLVPLICLLTVGISIGATNNVAKIGVGWGVPLIGLLFWAVVGAAILLGILAVIAKKIPALNRVTLVYGLVSGLLLMAMPTSITFLAAPRVGAGFVSLSLAFVPLITYVFAILLRIEAFRWLRVAGVVAGLAGALLLALNKSRAPGAEPEWIAATLAIPVIIAIGNIYRTLRWPPGAASLSLAPLMLAGAALWLIPFATSSSLEVLGDARGIGLAFGQAAIFTLTYSLYFVLQRIAGAVYLSQIGSVGAISGAGIAIFAFGEAAPPGLAGAGALIVAGIALFSIGRKPG